MRVKQIIFRRYVPCFVDIGREPLPLIYADTLQDLLNDKHFKYVSSLPEFKQFIGSKDEIFSEFYSEKEGTSRHLEGRVNDPKLITDLPQLRGKKK